MEGSSAGALPVLPDDPLVEILSRVPARSICRFKCVSKAWRNLIADPDHRKKLRQPMQGFFVQTEEFSASEVNHFVRNTSYSFIDLTVRSVPLDNEPCFSFLAEGEMTEFKSFFLDSCNGLILFLQYQGLHISDRYIVCNPTTKQWSAVPACPRRDDDAWTCLAFDPTISSHFHLVQFQLSEEIETVSSLDVYSSETGSWSQFEGWHHQFTLEDFQHHAAFVNGSLHLIIWDSDLPHILAVDVVKRKARRITVPGMTDGGHGHKKFCYLGKSQGHLHCVTLESSDEKSGELCTWVLRDYDAQEWVLKNTVNSLDVFGEKEGMPYFRVVDIHLDCNVVFFLHQCKLTAFDMDRKEVSVIATFKDQKHPRNFVCHVPYFSESPALTNKY